MAEVQHVFRCLVHRFPMEEVAQAEAIANKGLKGCIHGHSGSKRQVLLMDRETLDKFGLTPGAVKENVTTLGMDFQSLTTGQILSVGDSILEITVPCDPCSRMDEIRMGLQEELRGQRGWLCKVIRAGKIRRGDRIEVLENAGGASAVVAQVS
jgi:MOSC domain-containing protein YiiM